MADLKHVGRVVSNKRKVAVAYRVLPGDENSCLVVPTESLTAEEHDTLIRLIESPAGQSAYELGEAMARTRLPDGRIMLAAFHKFGRLVKLSTSEIEMVPNNNTTVNLKVLNETIADQKGVSVADLAIKDSNQQTETETEPNNDVVETPAVEPAASSTEVLDDSTLAKNLLDQSKSMVAQAEALLAESKRLEAEAYDLDSTLQPKAAKKTIVKKTTAKKTTAKKKQSA